jgi:hypothetical protein
MPPSPNFEGRRFMMLKRFVPLMLVLLVISFGTLEAKEIKKDFHKSFDVDRGDTLRLSHGDGNVIIRPWDRDVLDVTVRYHVEERTVGIGANHEFDVEFRQTGSTVYVLEKKRTGIIMGFHNRRTFEYVYEIKGPDYLLLDLDGDDGDMDIQQWRGNIDCRLDDGDIDIRDIAAQQIDIKAEDGKIRVSGLQGNLRIKCDDGDIELQNCRFETIRLEGEDGDLSARDCSGDFWVRLDDADVTFQGILAGKLELIGEDGRIDLDLLGTDSLDADIRMDDGDVDVLLDRGFSLSFTTRTDDGHVRIDLEDIQNFEDERHIKSGDINGGRGRLRIQTNDGDIAIKER